MIRRAPKWFEQDRQTAINWGAVLSRMRAEGRTFRLNDSRSSSARPPVVGVAAMLAVLVGVLLCWGAL